VVVLQDRNKDYDDSNEKSITDKEARKREARKKKRAEASKLRQNRHDSTENNATLNKPKTPTCTVAVIPSGEPAPGPVAEAMAQCPKTLTQAAQGSRLALPEDVQLLIPLLLPSAAKPIMASLSQEIVPTVPEARSPEDIMAKMIGEKGPSAKVAKVTELQDAIAKLKSMLATSGGSGEQLDDLEHIITKKLEVMELALTKAQRDVPSQLSELKSVQEAKLSYELSIQTRKDQQARGALKASERKKERREHIKALREQIDILEKNMTKLETDNDAAHAARATASSDIDTKVLELFDKKVSILQAPTPPKAPSAPGTSSSPPPPQTQALALPPPEIVQTPNTLTELNEFKAKFEDMRMRLEAATGAMVKQFGATIEDLNPNMLPETEIPEGDAIMAYAAIFDFLQQWKLGEAAPFDWETIDTAAGPAHSAVEIVQKLVGNVWSKWYGSEPAPTTVVPRQLALTVDHCLSNVKTVFEASDQKKAIRELAEKAGIVAKASAKRLRSD